MNRSARRAAAAEANATRESEAFISRVPIAADAGPTLVPTTATVAARPRKPARSTSPTVTSLADDEPLEGTIPLKRRLDLGFGLVIDSRELVDALRALADRVASRTETIPPQWTREEWRDSCRGAWNGTPRWDDESPDHTQRRCYRCALCTWEEWLDAYNAQHPESDRPIKDRPPPPTIEECVGTATYRTRGGEGLSSMGSTLGNMIERADVFGRPRADIRDRESMKAAARRAKAWAPGRETVSINGRVREVATPWTRRVEANPTRSLQAHTPEWAQQIERVEEIAISWRWALSDPEARGGLTEHEAEVVVRTRTQRHVWTGTDDELDRYGDDSHDDRWQPYPVELIAADVGRSVEEVRGIIGAVLSRFRADLAARRFLPPVHPRSSAWKTYQERVAVRLGVVERAAARERGDGDGPT